ncbi:hypothetical protein H920_18235 [Fukomys damarensis]|uniref:Uncharacterized protein n=1 Tax=Fukomys damarensis TaxID=885580 RepID=A0A091CRD2_FUKDA|nr:hypothetical protein H920_18235 [Fukomys damarensis]
MMAELILGFDFTTLSPWLELIGPLGPWDLSWSNQIISTGDLDMGFRDLSLSAGSVKWRLVNVKPKERARGKADASANQQMESFCYEKENQEVTQGE